VTYLKNLKARTEHQQLLVLLAEKLDRSVAVAARKHPGSDPQTSSFSAQIICQ
jgi:hypothetical protein